MLQRYKLRLGDGTVLGVDRAGLKTWAVDGQAMVQAAASQRWYPLKAFLAAERAAAKRAARLREKQAGVSSGGPARPLPLVYPAPQEPKPCPPAAPAPSEPPPLVALSPEVQVLPEPPASPRLREAISDEAAVALLALPITEPALAPVPESVDLEPLAEELVPIAEGVSLALTEDSPHEPVLEADLTATSGRDLEQAWISDDDLPTFPASHGGRDEPARVDLFAQSEPAEPPFIDVPQGLEVAADVPSPSPSARPSLQVLADDLATGRPAPGTEAWRPHSELPIIPLKPLGREAPAAPGLGTYEGKGKPDEALAAAPRSELDEKLIRWFARAISAYDAVLTGWIERMARRAGAIETVGPPAVPPAAPPESVLQGPSSATLPVAPLKAPPALRDLPILRLADVPEPEEEGDIYETERPLHAAWRWTKRVVVASALLAGGLVAVLRFESWGPRAGQLGQAALGELDRIREARDHAEQQRLALLEATERLPQLAPQTIRLLMSQSPTGTLEPSELLQVASAAADRGAGALLPHEAQELKDLRGKWLEALRPSERERIREYDAVRVRRFVFPFEARGVLELFERGADALPPERRQRLQELLAKAIAAGVPATPKAPPDLPAKPRLQM